MGGPLDGGLIPHSTGRLMSRQGTQQCQHEPQRLLQHPGAFCLGGHPCGEGKKPGPIPSEQAGILPRFSLTTGDAGPKHS